MTCHSPVVNYLLDSRQLVQFHDELSDEDILGSLLVLFIPKGGGGGIEHASPLDPIFKTD